MSIVVLKLAVVKVFGVRLSHMSGWRDVQEAGKQIRRRLKWKPAWIVGVDGAWVNGKGIMVAVDLGDGELLSLAEIDENGSLVESLETTASHWSDCDR